MEKFDWQDFILDRMKTRALGQGASAIVAVATWTKRNKIVAVKLVTESFCEQKDLEYEEETAALLSEGEVLLHANQKAVQNVISIYGTVSGRLPSQIADVIGMYANENDLAFGLVSEYLEGIKTLSALLYPKASVEPKKPLSMSELVFILKEIGAALADMHIVGLIHGDIKPQNVLISSHTPPLIKLIDFGLSSLRQNAALKAFGNSTMKSTLNFKGTMFYAAPGGASGAAASRSTDIYAFAVLCWEALSQRRPFTNDPQFPQSAINGARPPLELLPSDTPSGVMKMIELCWSQERSNRISAVECLSILQHEFEVLSSGQFDIFFSHAWDNKPFLSHVHRFLVRGGYRVWYDIKEMGHDLQESMIQGIERSKVVLVCLNRLYLNRDNCLFELKEAYKRSKILIVLIIETKVQLEKHEAIDLCQLSRKFYVDIGQLATLNQWYDESALEEMILVELNQQLSPLFTLLKNVECLPSCLSNSDNINQKQSGVERAIVDFKVQSLHLEPELSYALPTTSAASTNVSSGNPNTSSLPLLPGKQYHVFLSHNWGNDELHRNNHERVKKINTILKQNGLITWLDEEINLFLVPSRQTVTDALHGSMIVLCFITKVYEMKINSGDLADSCNFEFNLASSNYRISIAMEKSMLNPYHWQKGRLKSELGGELIVDMTEDDDKPEIFHQQIQQLMSRILTLEDLWTSARPPVSTASNALRNFSSQDFAIGPPLSKGKQFHVFLSHNWGNDESGRNNHQRVSKINNLLKQSGLITWFDEDQTLGNIRQCMTDGLSQSMIILIFITRRYEQKINKGNYPENCFFEFNFASTNPHLVNHRIPIIMEESMLNLSNWEKIGRLRIELGGELIVDMTKDDDKPEIFHQQIQQLIYRIHDILEVISQRI